MAALVNKSHACIICMKRKETDPDLIFHRFPKDQEQCFKWKIAINVIQINGKTPEQLNRSYRVCSRHFSRKNYLDAKSNRLCHNGCPDKNLEGSNCSTPAIPDCSHIVSGVKNIDLQEESDASKFLLVYPDITVHDLHFGTTAQFRDKESEDVRAIISSVPHETIQSFHDEPNPQHPASGADSNGQHVPPFELHENLNDELNLEHPASEVNSNEQDVPPFEPQEILNEIQHYECRDIYYGMYNVQCYMHILCMNVSMLLFVRHDFFWF
ncbi:uncharacterized protein LOC143031054 isoform X2 [Oratosquilla oratoria]|uniref:uncharacterized protein LOC143031054 isoform X2 n=1 Tax=Oratosquilla oratoria TaxID=337810 RepID=UPI003F75D79E